MSAEHRGRPLHGLRVMVHADLRQVLRIEADSFGHPWSERDFVEHLEDPYSVALVFEQSGLIVGYEVFGIGTPWIHLYSCVVRRAVRGRGIGSRMVTHLARVAPARQAGGILVKVPERNVGSQLFFRQCGFRAVKILPAYLLDDEDVYVMQHSPPGWMPPSFDFRVPGEELIPLWEVKHGCSGHRVGG